MLRASPGTPAAIVGADTRRTARPWPGAPREPFSLAALGEGYGGRHFDDAVLSPLTMPNTRIPSEEQEPLGIIISRGSRAEAAPRFWAYVWGPAPELGVTSPETKAA